MRSSLLSAFAAAAVAQQWGVTQLSDGSLAKHPGCIDQRYCIYPIADSELLPGQVFDFYLEVHGTAPSATPTVEVQPQGSTSWVPIPSLSADGKVTVPVETKSWTLQYRNPDISRFNTTQKGALAYDTTPANGYWWRRVAINNVGRHTVRVTSGADVRTIEIVVIAPTPRKAKNIILFIGDGLNIPIITAGALVSRGQLGGKLKGRLHMQTLSRVGLMSTSGLDSIMTDSANSAYAYSGGHKSNVNALGVYCDSDDKAAEGASKADDFNDPHVELLTERMRREIPAAAIGVVTTSEIQDATPAAFWAHTRRRSQKARITEQMLYGARGYGPVLPDVVMGGGGVYFNGSKGLSGRNLWAEAEAKGYSIALDRGAMKAAALKADKLLGIWHATNEDTWVDRHQMTWNLDPANFPMVGVPKRNVTDQPDLQEQTEVAISMLARKGGDNGFFLMVEGASIDKQEHPMDFDRAMGELIDMDNAIGSALAFAASPGGRDTLVLVTSDHAQGYDVYGSVDTMVFNAPNPVDNRELNLTEYLAVEPSKAAAVGLYADAGFPTYVDANGDNFPDSWMPRYTLAQGKVDHLADYREDFQASLTPRLPAINPGNVPRTIDNKLASGTSNSLSDDKQGLRLQGTTDPAQTGGQTVHTLADVPLYGSGPGSERIRPHMDNVDLHFLMARALGLGSSAAIMPPMPGAGVAVQDITCDAVVPTVFKHATLGLLTTVCAPGQANCDASHPLVVGTKTYYRLQGTMEALNLVAADGTCSA